MRAKTMAAILAAFCLAALLPVTTAHAGKPKPVTVGKDKAGDWGCNADACELSALGDGLGQDLVKASIGMANRKKVNFVIQVNSLPPWGGVPEFSRYTWELIVDRSGVQLSGAFTEYIRGICNPTYNPMICPPPRDPGEAPFFVRVGGCTVGGPCEEKGMVHAKFDPNKGTITIPVPLKVLGAKPGSKIGPGASLFGGTIYAAPAAMVTNGSMPADTLMVGKTFRVPK